MANYATNIFHARTENKTDLDKIANKVSKTKNPKEQFKNCSLRLRKP